jgi:hypothetical protein
MGQVRSLSVQELAALRRLVHELPAEDRSRAMVDLESSEVKSMAEDDSRLQFQIAGYVRPSYRGQHAYPVEAVVTDEDGAQVTVCLYADHQDRLLELELIKWGDTPLKRVRWETLEIRSSADSTGKCDT